MKLFFSLFFLFFSFSPFQSQGQVLMDYQVYQNMDQFDWLDFINEENIQEHINFRNQRFNLHAVNNTITGLNIAKLQLLRIEQELGLYRQRIKTGLPVDIRDAEGAIQSHLNNIINIEQKIQAQAGFRDTIMESGVFAATPELTGRLLESTGITDYRNGVKELYKGDHDVMFNIVEKKDQNLYNLLGQNDELFAEFALPQVEKYTTKMENTAGAFYSALSSLDQNSTTGLDRDTVNTLIFMFDDSLEIYNCFLKNFPNPEGESQQELKRIIEDWHEQQSEWGAEALMTAYQYGIKNHPTKVTRSLLDFQIVSSDTKTKMGAFYRDEFLNNPDFNNPYFQGARVNALIGLKYLDLLEGSEVELFDKAVEEGVIKSLGENSFSSTTKPLPILP